ncbi:MAG: hypothetical protein V8R10_13385 [Christensenellales bacterium]
MPLFRDNKLRILVLTPIEIGENVAEWDTLYGKGEESRKFPALMKGLCEWLGVEMMNTQEIVQPSKVDGIHMMPEEHRKLALAVKERLRAAGNGWQSKMSPCRVKCPLWGLGQRPNCSAGDQFQGSRQQRRRQRSVPASNFARPQTRPQAALSPRFQLEMSNDWRTNAIIAH